MEACIRRGTFRLSIVPLLPYLFAFTGLLSILGAVDSKIPLERVTIVEQGREVAQGYLVTERDGRWYVGTPNGIVVYVETPASVTTITKAPTPPRGEPLSERIGIPHIGALRWVAYGLLAIGGLSLVLWSEFNLESAKKEEAGVEEA